MEKKNTVLILYFPLSKLSTVRSLPSIHNNVGQGVSTNITFCIKFRDKYLSNPFTKITNGIQFAFVDILETERSYSLKNCTWVYVQLLFTKRINKK